MDIDCKVFIPDEEFIWLKAETVVSTAQNDTAAVGAGNGTFVEVKITEEGHKDFGKHRRISLSNLPDKMQHLPLQNLDIPSSGADNMCSISYLHEASILDNLSRRFKSEKPYTYTGDICIAVNPYKWLDIYSSSIRQQYLNAQKADLMPHVYSTSASAYRDLTQFNRNHSILVSGESGAGKTETVKILLEHIAEMASNNDIKRSVGGAGIDESLTSLGPGPKDVIGDDANNNNNIITKILRGNPLLESFGNAKTVRNDNSSRFGKFIELQFDKKRYNMIGSKTTTYLLEKSRVVLQSDRERNYHIFYELLATSDDFKSQFGLQNKSKTDFKYTKFSDVKTTKIEGLSDKDRFESTRSAISILGIPIHVQMQVWRLLSAVLHLGDLEFESTGVNKQNLLTNSEAYINLCCELLGLSTPDFIDAMTNRSLDVEGTRIKVNLSVEQSNLCKDAFAKEIYSRVFSWLVDTINYNTFATTSKNQQNHDGSIGSGADGGGGHLMIALLDIFGFESLQTNNFEQFCINYANEKLQQKFTLDVFKSVMSDYRSEGIEIEDICYKDNASIIEFIEGKQGIMNLLNEECLVPKGSDTSLLFKLKGVWTSSSLSSSSSSSSNASNLTSSNIFSMASKMKNSFSVNHYAGSVTYSIDGFLEKNKDAFPSDLKQLMAKSTNKLATLVFSDSYEIIHESEDSFDSVLMHNRASLKRLLLIEDTTEQGLSDVLSSKEDELEIDFTKSSRDLAIRSQVASNLNQAKKPQKRKSFMLSETVSLKFKSQLNLLMEKINSTEVHYVRCIKPNDSKSSLDFNRTMAVHQLRYAGVIEAIRISRSSFPNIVSHRDFLDRFFNAFAYLGAFGSEKEKKTKLISSSQVTADRFETLMSFVMNRYHASSDNEHNQKKLFHIGKKKLFFAKNILEFIESTRTAAICSSVTTLQATARMISHRKPYLNLKRKTIRIQAFIRSAFAQKQYKILLQSARIIKRICSRHINRKIELRIKKEKSALKIQSFLRMRKKRVFYKNILNKFVKFQAIFRRNMTMKKTTPMLIIWREENKTKFKLDVALRSVQKLSSENEELKLQNKLLAAQAQKSAEIAKLMELIAMKDVEIERLLIKNLELEERKISYSNSGNNHNHNKGNVFTLVAKANNESKQRSNTTKVVHANYVSPIAAAKGAQDSSNSNNNNNNNDNNNNSNKYRATNGDISKYFSPVKTTDKSRHHVVKIPTVEEMKVQLQDKASSGLMVGVYLMNQLKASKAKAARIKVAVSKSDGAVRIECVLSGNISLQTEHHISNQDKDKDKENNGLGGNSNNNATSKEDDNSSSQNAIRKLKFKFKDVVEIRAGKGGSVTSNSNDSIEDNRCLCIMIQGKGELNLVLECESVRNNLIQALLSIHAEMKLDSVIRTQANIAKPLGEGEVAGGSGSGGASVATSLLNPIPNPSGLVVKHVTNKALK